MAETDKVALITGGAKRIGKAIALDLAAHGFTVAIHYSTSRQEADSTAAMIRRNGGRAAVVQADLANSIETGVLLEKTAEAVGVPGVIVNNASLFEDDCVTDFQDDVWDRHFAVHVKAPARIAQSFSKMLADDREGLIVNMIDQRVWRQTPRFFSYTLSKSALWTATRTMAQALGPRIRVNAIGPGPTLPNERQEQADFDRQTNALILRRGPALEEFGAAIRFLREARSVTGQMIALDGGQHLAWETPDVAGVTE